MSPPSWAVALGITPQDWMNVRALQGVTGYLNGGAPGNAYKDNAQAVAAATGLSISVAALDELSLQVPAAGGSGTYTIYSLEVEWS